MSVKELQAFNFRNLSTAKVNFHSKLNFFIGGNGSGKSSLLESLFYLGHGKSFRSTNVNSLINTSSDNFVVTVKTDSDNQLGIQRSQSGEIKIKINGVKHNKLSDLAKNVAIQVVTPESFKLFFGGPKERRKFIDLGLFHVKHSFPSDWKTFNRILKQRNACLKNKVAGDQYSYWTEEFCQLSESIAQERSAYIEGLREELLVWLKLFLPTIEDDITIQYLQGWHSKKELREVLIVNKQREYEKGYSLFGAHKFDVRFLLNNLTLEQRLSRGQQKLFLLALTFAQTKLIEQGKRVKPILLIDDVGAELDINSRSIIANINNHLDCQTMITAIDRVALEPIIPDNDNYKMFHVKHGHISAMSK
ncbi:DNA replication and repair protein RecF [Thalassotalea insulae]|uniref:DNA replication and repair protein RecF n=1 Tax=Thalassotalea insulae TaxID=2056778 RepID=A0ABQ6GT61_9GAMM|nr:DNA replication/repair protein RecF [Thalassotalea insulae]GLX78499.1 DNA replication and repair protein RecF [Thalassotalea insulae]